MKTITKALQEAMKAYGSVYRVAKDSGIHEAQLQRFANGERGLHSKAIDKLAAFFGLELHQAPGTEGPLSETAPKVKPTKGRKP